MNSMRLTALMALLTLILVSLGSLAGGVRGAFAAFVVSALLNAVTYFRSGPSTLKRLGARPETDSESRLRRTVALVARSAGAARIHNPQQGTECAGDRT
ncbi:MAG: hypothetical protein ACE5GA_01025 [Candidatus Zixiibacteriota bacterium]